ncbi:MAG: CCA tRNA nucleotidyltransferase [Phycisphaerales bacterium JB037]
MPRAADPSLARSAAIAVIRELRAHGHIALLAGGCVRDELLGFDPTDYDVATDATPDRVSAIFGSAHEVGASFGVMLVRMPAAVIEVATFRSDGPYSDSRRPDTVHFSDPKNDAARRDFTVNALFLDPVRTPDEVSRDAAFAGAQINEAHHGTTPDSGGEPIGTVIDFVGGLADLAAKTIKAVGDPDARLREDQLRALRAIRFAARYGFELDEATADAIRAHANELKGVSRERIGDEVRRMFAHPSRAVAAWTLQYLGLDLPVLGRHVTRSPGTLGRLVHDAAYPTCLAAWLLDRGEVVEATQIAGVVRNARDALNLSNDERGALRDTLAGVGLLGRSWGGMPIARQKRAAASAWFGPALQIRAAESPEEMVRIRRRVEELRQTPSGIAPEPLISGNDLIQSGFQPGPGFQRVLEAVYDAQLEDRIATREEALELARRSFEELGR